MIMTVLMVVIAEVTVCCSHCREKPLAFYVFTENKKTLQMVSNRTSSGALVHNDTIIYGGGE